VRVESESVLDSGDGVKEEKILFMSDASAEAERLIVALRTNGYLVADVPFALLAGRVAVQRPALVLCDADAEGALDTLTRIRGMTPDNVVPVVLLGHRDGAIARIEGSLVEAVFARPVNVTELVSTVERLVGSPRANVSISPSVRPSKPVGSSHPPKRASVSERPIRADTSGPMISLPPDLAAEGNAPRESAEAPVVELGSDLVDRLRAAERRLAERAPASTSPRDDHEADLEPEGPLAPEVLDALAGPVDEEDAGEDSALREGAADGTGGLSGSKSLGRGGTQIGTTSIGGTSTGIGGTSGTSLGTDMISMSGDPDGLGAGLRSGAAGTRVSSEPPPPSVEELDEERIARQRASTPKPPKPNPDAEPETQPPRRLSVPPPTMHEPVPILPSAEERDAAGGATVVHADKPIADDERPGDRAGPERADRGTERPGEGHGSQPPAFGAEAEPVPVAPTALGAGGAITTLAHAIRTRFTGAMAFEVDEGIRRVVLREGDFVTAASGVHSESLVAFLGGRGDLPEDVVRQAHKLPQFGRRAGAALIANGHLAQDDLWPVLRAHAEWIIGRIARIERGRARGEELVPGRLQDEPAVFGGATGAEVLVEVVRRVVPPEEALALLGGPSASIGAGPSKSLLGECALPAMEADLVQHASSSALGELTRTIPDPSFVPVVYALVALGILATETAVARKAGDDAPAKDHDAIDDDALRERILTRKALVDEGDYFAVLGVARSATGYDIRRAYTTLRREFEPSRVLTAATADLGDTVTDIVQVLEEAYEILSDQRRRDRYRKAIEAVP
jgi:hypothetical protein